MRQRLDRIARRGAAVCHRAALGDEDDLALRRLHGGQLCSSIEHFTVEVDGERLIGCIVRVHLVVIGEQRGIVVGQRHRIVNERELQFLGNAADKFRQNNSRALVGSAVVDGGNHCGKVNFGRGRQRLQIRNQTLIGGQKIGKCALAAHAAPIVGALHHNDDVGFRAHRGRVLCGGGVPQRGFCRLDIVCALRGHHIGCRLAAVDDLVAVAEQILQAIRVVIRLVLCAGALRDAVADAENGDFLTRCDFLCAGILPLGKHILLHQFVGNDLAGFRLGGKCAEADGKGIAALEIGGCGMFGHAEFARERERVAPHKVAAAVVFVGIAHRAQHQCEEFRFADRRIRVEINASGGVLFACDKVVGNRIADIGVRPVGHIVKRRLRRLGFCRVLNAEIAFEQDDRLRAGQVVGKAEAVACIGIALHKTERIQAVCGIRLRRCGGNGKGKQQCKKKQKRKNFFHVCPPSI